MGTSLMFTSLIATNLFSAHRGIVRFQSNTGQHDPEYCSASEEKFNMDPKCKVSPQFVTFGMNVS